MVRMGEWALRRQHSAQARMWQGMKAAHDADLGRPHAAQHEHFGQDEQAGKGCHSV
jgi:hypothetical protein